MLSLHRNRGCRSAVVVLAALVLGIAGCKNPFKSPPGHTEAPLPPLQQYAILDLVARTVSQSEMLPDLNTNPAFKSSQMVFRLIPGNIYEVGTPSSERVRQADEIVAQVALDSFYLGVFEVTQAQWKQIAGASATPWSTIGPPDVTGSPASSDEKPAYGISFAALTTALQAYDNAHPERAQLVVPSDAQWEVACRGKPNFQVFAWGNSFSPDVAAPFALLNETHGLTVGVRPVGSLRPNDNQLYDIHGNVREWSYSTSAGKAHLRGGGWSDNVALVRCANLMGTVSDSTSHALSGARLVLRLPGR